MNNVLNTHSDLNNQMNSVSIIGMGCRYPGNVNNLNEYWALLLNKNNAITEVPEHRWNIDRFYNVHTKGPGKAHTKWGGFVNNIDYFDASFFGISPREAVRMDPQQRLLLEVTWEALEDAGIDPAFLKGSNTGVYIGISSGDYWDMQLGIHDRDTIDAYTNLGGSMSIAANRISYIYGLNGPSMAVDTACSSALVAVHLACKSVLGGESDIAIVGGVNALLKPEVTIGFSKANMLSKDGHCKAFDKSANGYVRGEGAGVIIIKKLSHAVRDQNRIYAVIQNTAVNQDGRSEGITVPSQKSQENMLREAYSQADIDPKYVDYVEAHGTGTPVGDPIEANAIGNIIGIRKSPDSPCYLGSVKTNIGHLESGSGIAGIIKTSLALHNCVIPPNLHFETPNPAIRFDALNLKVPTEPVSWPDNKDRVAGVNSFGFGGTNAHVVLRGFNITQKDPPHRNEKNNIRYQLVTLSAGSEKSLSRYARRLLEYINENERLTLTELSYATNARRSHHPYRMAVVENSIHNLKERLENYLNGDDTTIEYKSSGSVANKSQKLVFVFSGMGPQWWAMGRKLYDTEPGFRNTIDNCDSLFTKIAGWSLCKHLLVENEGLSRISETQIAQPLNFALQAGLAELLTSWEIQADIVIGHSTGEVAAAYFSGSLSLEDAIMVIYHRSRLQQTVAGTGTMLAAGVSAEEAEKIIRKYDSRVSLAAINSPKSVTLSGERGLLEDISAFMDATSVFNRFLKVEVPFHSAFMDPIEQEFRHCLRHIKPNNSRIPLYSTVTGERVTEACHEEHYWWRNMREPVRFSQGINAILDDGPSIFIEISPHPVLLASIKEICSDQGIESPVIRTLKRQEDDQHMLMHTLADLYTEGVTPKWDCLYPSVPEFKGFPLYPWDHERFWHESLNSISARLKSEDHPLLGYAVNTPQRVWRKELSIQEHNYLSDHIIQQVIVYPGAAYTETALAACRNIFPDRYPVAENIRFEKALFLDNDDYRYLSFTVDSENHFEIHSRQHDADQWIKHCKGQLSAHTRPLDNDLLFQYAESECKTGYSINKMYDRFQDIGLSYGPYFKGIQSLLLGDKKAFATISLPLMSDEENSRYHFHPALMDAAFQILFTTLERFRSDQLFPLYLPVSIDRIRLNRKVPNDILVYATQTVDSPDIVKGDISVFSRQKELLVHIQGFQCKRVQKSVPDQHYLQWLYEYTWLPKSNNKSAVKNIPADLSISDSACQLTDKSKQLADEHDRQTYYKKVEPVLNRLSALYFCRALTELGYRWHAGTRIDPDRIMTATDIDVKYRKFVSRFITILSAHGFISAAEQGSLVSGKLPDFGQITYLRNKLETMYDQYEPEFTLIINCGESLAGILTGKIDPLGVLFPEGSLSEARHFYQNSNSFKIYNKLISHFVQNLIEHIPSDTTVRILEIGAGTGGLSAHVLEAVSNSRIEYMFTDVSPGFLTDAGRYFSEFDFIDYQYLDIEKDPLSQGFETNSYDVILASDVLHATENIGIVLDNIKKLLSPKGCLILLETTQRIPWVDLVFGVTEGWWRFKDTDVRPDHPTLSTDQWTKVLKEHKFNEVFVCNDHADQSLAEQSVVLAQGPDVISDSHEVDSEPEKEMYVLFLHNDPLCEHVAKTLEESGKKIIRVYPDPGLIEKITECVSVRPNFRQDYGKLIDNLKGALDEGCLINFVHLWSLLNEKTDTGLYELTYSQEFSSHSLLFLLQSIIEKKIVDNAALSVITRGHNIFHPESGISQIHSATVMGIARVLMTEHPRLKCRLVDLDISGIHEQAVNLVNELTGTSILNKNLYEQEVCYRGKQRYVKRLNRFTYEKLARSKCTDTMDNDSGYALSFGKAGDLSTLRYQTKARKRPQKNEVEIKVSAAGLNFKDIMIATGKLPPETTLGTFCGNEIGMEVSGWISAVGESVSQFEVGMPVLGFATSCFGNYVTTHADLVIQKPVHLTFEQAAQVPVALVTAYYALVKVARLSRGQRILIHAATGGVGLWAIELANWIGAEIYATAGSEKKRTYLRNRGIRHVMDSRSLDYVEYINAETHHEGIDVILNSLSGPAIDQNFSLLKPFGVFLEIGKSDIYQNKRIGLYPFGENLSYTAIDLDKFILQRSHDIKAMLEEVSALLSDQKIHPMPCTVFPARFAENAFRYMAQSRHIGKVVITLEHQHPPVMPSQNQHAVIHPDATYLITGGTGGFGLEVGKWLGSRGARSLVLVSRSGVRDSIAQSVIDQLIEGNISVLVETANVSDYSEMKELFDRIDRQLPPLKGVFHAAMVLDDGALVSMNPSRMEKVFAPKAYGAYNLHELTKDRQLDHFVLFSSCTVLFGNPGQANYVAANTYLDALAHYRHAKGLPALAIDWGALNETGFVSKNEKVKELLAQQGLSGFTNRQVTNILDKLLSISYPQIGVMDMDWGKWAKENMELSQNARFSRIFLNKQKITDNGFRQDTGHRTENLLDKIHKMEDPASKSAILTEAVSRWVAKILKIHQSKVSLDISLVNQGLDSLMAIELQLCLQDEFGFDAIAMELVQGLSVPQIVERILRFAGDKGPDVHSHKNIDINKEFIEWITSTKQYFETAYQDWGRREFNAGNDISEDDKKHIEELSKHLVTIRNELNIHIAHLGHSDQAHHRAYFRKHLSEWYMRSSLFERAYVKPLGYAGDYEMMNIIYRQIKSGKRLFDLAMDHYALHEDASQAVLNRTQYICDHLIKDINQIEGRRFRVASIGCGPAWEITALLSKHPELAERMDILFLDQDEKALACVRKRMREYVENGRLKVSYISSPVDQLFDAQELSTMIGKRDVIYSIGLFDYFTPQTFRRLLHYLYTIIDRRGRLYIGNASTDNATRYIMEFVADWFIIHRSCEELLSMANDLSPKPSFKTIESEPLGVNLFLVIEK